MTSSNSRRETSGRADSKLIEIDAEIAEIAAERSEADRRVGEVVALAEFDEPSERLQQAEAALHRFARERIEDDRRRRARRSTRMTSSTKAAGARIEGVLGAERERKRALFRRSRGDDRARATPTARSAAPPARRRPRRHE